MFNNDDQNKTNMNSIFNENQLKEDQISPRIDKVQEPPTK